ncbi:MAG TPA: hypothetical protein VMM76_14640, partial [Pirellulaceae bacterium]|nr:hypothetical protein [Pirellulaceae bacterium]
MPSKFWTIVWLTLTLLMCGCSGSDVSEVAGLSGVQPLAATFSAPAPTIGPELTAEISSRPTADAIAASPQIEPFRNPFAPPKDLPPLPVVEEPKPEPELGRKAEPTTEVGPLKTPPTIRLLGFMNIGEPKVLVSFRDELKTLAIGDMLVEMKVVKIDSPELTMVFDERDIKLNLFDQAWRHEGSASSIDNSRSYARPRSHRPSPSTSSSPSSSTPGGASASRTSSGPARSVGGIPGFGP